MQILDDQWDSTLLVLNQPLFMALLCGNDINMHVLYFFYL